MGFVVVGALVVLGCSSGGSAGGDASTSTTESAAVVTALPPSPSTIAPVVSICASLGDLYGVDDLEVHSGNWTQERQRVLTDANREARLLRSASAGAPDALRGSLDRLTTWVDGVIVAVDRSPSYDAARTAMAALDRTGVSAASSAVTAWHDANC